MHLDDQVDLIRELMLSGTCHKVTESHKIIFLYIGTHTHMHTHVCIYKEPMPSSHCPKVLHGHANNCGSENRSMTRHHGNQTTLQATPRFNRLAFDRLHSENIKKLRRLDRTL